ncbi:MAG: arginine--tRNA ligase [Nanoarchaeota archaeon]|nr:arginine--tRNA ligase [Nanoarchaeota archaeon]
MQVFKEAIINLLKKEVNGSIELETPPDSKLGDYAFPCFGLAKQLKKSPIEIAKDLASKLKPNKYIKEIKSTGPYVNFFVNESILAELILNNISSGKDDYGKAKKKKERVMIEFSQPNTHKGFHIGHLRNASLGDSLVRIMRFNGYDVVAANYIGDIGAHIAKCIWYYLKFYKNKEPKTNKGEWLGSIYTEASKIVAENEEYKKEIQKIQRKLEDGNKELTELWEKTKEWSMQDFYKIYKELGINFDVFFFESQVEKPGKKIVLDMLKKGIAEKSDGAVIINLEKYGLKVFLLLKSDGTSLYSTKDFALAKKKFDDYKIDKSIYVIGSEQRFHLKQLFKTLEIIGFKQAKKCYHLSYELVMLKEGKMSSRLGNIVLYFELSKKIFEKASKEVEKRHKQWPEKDKEKATKQIAVAAMKFSMLNQDNNKTIVFDINKALDFEGETGPYIQYAHARICSILRKFGKRIDKGFIDKADLSLLKEKEETELIKLLGKFPDVVENAASSYKPSLISRYLLDLSQGFNEFYHIHQILKEREELKNTRILLIDSIRQVLKNGLNLLGIEAPERM